MTDFEKAQKNLKNDMFILFILELIIHIFSLITDIFNFWTIVLSLVFAMGYIFAIKGKKIAGIIGIVVGILMMLTILFGDIIDFVLGLFVLIHSVKYNKLFI